MKRRKVAFSSDLRWVALKRAGLAVVMALVLLVGMLWYGDQDSEPPQIEPPSRPIQVDVQPESVQPDTSVQPDAVQPDAAQPDAVQPGAVQPDTSVQPDMPHVPTPTLESASEEPKQVKPLSDGYFVQLGVFDATDNASRLLDNAAALGLPAHIQRRVVVGPFRNKREAEAVRNRLSEFAEGIILPPQRDAKAGRTPKAKSRRRAR